MRELEQLDEGLRFVRAVLVAVPLSLAVWAAIGMVVYGAVWLV